VILYACTVLVDVVRLRDRGARVPREQLSSVPAVRGGLQLNSARPGYYAGKREAPLLAGLVAPGSSEWALPPLDRAQVRKIRNGNMLLVGLEEAPRENNRGQELVPQALWVRVVR
jgi:hypothetical protein